MQFTIDMNEQPRVVSGIANAMLRQKRTGEVDSQDPINVSSPEGFSQTPVRDSLPDAPNCVAFMEHRAISYSFVFL
jgi:hypothetical protein